MHVIGHEAVGPELQPVPLAGAGQTTEIVIAIRI
jgi:hypothetical protein